MPITEFRTGMVQSAYGTLKKKSSRAFAKVSGLLNRTECSRQIRGTDERLIILDELSRLTLRPSMGWLCGLEETGLYLIHFMIPLG